MTQHPKGAVLVAAYDRALSAANQAAGGGSNDEFIASASEAMVARNAIINLIDDPVCAAGPELLEALKAMRVVMDSGGKPAKLDAALSWRECDEKARTMCDAAIAKAEVPAATSAEVS